MALLASSSLGQFTLALQTSSVYLAIQRVCFHQIFVKPLSNKLQSVYIHMWLIGKNHENNMNMFGLPTRVVKFLVYIAFAHLLPIVRDSQNTSVCCTCLFLYNNYGHRL